MPEDFGQFIWYELMTTDVAAAARFYQAVAGWGTQALEMPTMDYTVFTIPEQTVGVGGVLAMQPAQIADNIPPHWTGYVAVDDVDLCLADLVMLGGSVRRQPEDVPEVGRFAVVADPQGAVFTVFSPLEMDNPPPCAPMGVCGTFGWSELTTNDPEAAFVFYEKLLGWKKGDSIDMGPLGTYHFIDAGGAVNGGVMTCPEGGLMSFWSFYINVSSLDAALAAVTDGGGTVLSEAKEVPSGKWIAHARDPQGAYFALVAPQR